MNKLQKLIFLIEQNPLVEDFNDIKKILEKIFGYKNIKELSEESKSKNFNFSHGGRNQFYYFPDEESHIYEIMISDKIYTIQITGFQLQTCDCYYRVEEVYFDNISLIKFLKDTMKQYLKHLL